MTIELTYTPNFNQARAHYAASRMEEDGVPMPEAFAEWDRFIAGIRSAARSEGPTDDEVEAMARITVVESSGYEWETFSEASQHFHRETARRRMSAAREARR